MERRGQPLRTTILPDATSAPLAGAVLAVGVVGVAATRTLGLPLPPCPLRTLTGIPCPGCGAGRSISALLDGDFLAAVDHNVLVPLAIALIAWSAIAAFSRRSGARWWDPLAARWASLAVAAAIGGFWLLRLLPFGPAAWLAP